MIRRLLCLLGLPLATLAGPHHQGPPPRIVIDQTAVATGGILANLPVLPAALCDEDQAVEAQRCNSIDTPASRFQILLADDTGQVLSAVGIRHPDAVHDHLGRHRPLDLFRDGGPIDLAPLRAAADWLAQRHPDGRSGTLSWDRFLDNVRRARPMYGIVRVLVPADEHAPCGVHPEIEREHLGANARIEIYGTLLIDFVDCQGRPAPHPEAELEIEVPLLINPVAADPDGAPRALESLVALADPGLCQPTPCTVPLPVPSDPGPIPEVRRRHWELAHGEPLTPQRLAQLPPSQRLHLRMPSGYAAGWLRAFQTLALDQAQWRALGFATPDPDGPFDLTDLLDEAFQDLPALASNGGVLELEDHINVSGLLYLPGALELEAEGESHPHCEHHHPCAPRRAARQYLSGAILIGGAFAIEAHHPGTLTLLVNEPLSYSQIRLGPPGRLAAFRPLAPPAAAPPETGDAGDAPPPRLPPPAPPPEQRADGVPLPPQWVEIRPR